MMLPSLDKAAIAYSACWVAVALAVGGLLLGAGRAAAEPSTLAALRSQLGVYVRGHVRDPATRVSIPDLSDFEVPGEGVGELQFDFSTHPRTRWVGAVPVTVSVMSNGSERKRGVVAVRLESLRSVWTAVRSIRRGQVLTAADVRSVEQVAQRLPRDFVSAGEDISGKRVLRSVGQGSVLRSSWLDEPALVTRGEMVRVRLAAGALRIEARGRARDEGRAGDSIRVTNLDSNRELVGRIGRDGVVHVLY